MSDSAPLKRTPLYDLHRRCGGKIVPFAGYEMPVNFGDGILKEHEHTRSAAGLFDVSHMGQVTVAGDAVAEALETLIPADLISLADGRQKYGLLTNAGGGILDDLMVQHINGGYVVVVNAACKHADFAHLKSHLPEHTVTLVDDLALLALQGPTSATVMTDVGVDINMSEMKFMDVRKVTVAGIPCTASRSGYTGEDGFELSVAAADAEALAGKILAHEAVKPIGLGARDSLRLEAGLCLYGHDITTATTPVEAALNWAISPSRREGGNRAGGFPGADIILAQMPNKVTRRRVGLIADGRAPIREGATLSDGDGNPIGEVTSGGFAPTLRQPICMAYVAMQHATVGTKLQATVRGKSLPVTVAKLPFVAANFYR